VSVINELKGVQHWWNEADMENQSCRRPPCSRASESVTSFMNCSGLDCPPRWDADDYRLSHGPDTVCDSGTISELS